MPEQPETEEEEKKKKLERIRRRLREETAIIGDLRELPQRHCVERNAYRLRPELLVYIIRRLRGLDLAMDSRTYDRSVECLVAFLPPDTRRPRAATQVSRQVRKIMRLVNFPPGDTLRREAFVGEALDLLWDGINSRVPSDRIWEERFGLRYRSRLLNLVASTQVRLRRLGLLTEEQNGDVGLTPRFVQWNERHHSVKEDDHPPVQQRLPEVIAVLREALARLPHPHLRSSFQFDDKADLVVVQEIADQMGFTPRTIQNYRAEVRRLLEKDQLLRSRLRELGFVIRT